MPTTFLEKTFSLEGKVILVTGSSGGIGAALSEGCAYSGAEVALCARNMDKIMSLKEKIAQNGGKSDVFKLDVTSDASRKKCVEDVIARFGHIDGLLNVAGVNFREGILDMAEETYDLIMNTNLKGTYYMAREVALRMIERGRGGSIVNIGSYNSTSMLGGCAVYGATKSGVVAMTRAMCNEWAKYNIRANCISPGHILTDLTRENWIPGSERQRYLTERIAMGRPGRPDELVGLTILLCSDGGSYMDGAMYDVDGGCLSGGKPWPYKTQW